MSTKPSHAQRHEVVRSSRWVEYFEANRWDPESFGWPDSLDISDEERRALSRSVQVFQLGESGEGRHFLRVARRQETQGR